MLYLFNRYHPKDKAGTAGEPTSVVGEGRRAANACWFVFRVFGLQGEYDSLCGLVTRIIPQGAVLMDHFWNEHFWNSDEGFIQNSTRLRKFMNDNLVSRAFVADNKLSLLHFAHLLYGYKCT